jgi:hypothetical protein
MGDFKLVCRRTSIWLSAFAKGELELEDGLWPLFWTWLRAAKARCASDRFPLLRASASCLNSCLKFDGVALVGPRGRHVTRVVELPVASSLTDICKYTLTVT